jgi:hypothetical protein
VNHEHVLVSHKSKLKFLPLLLFSVMKKFFQGTELDIPVNNVVEVGMVVELGKKNT